MTLFPLLVVGLIVTFIGVALATLKDAATNWVAANDELADAPRRHLTQRAYMQRVG